MAAQTPADRSRSAVEHFTLYFHAAVLHVLDGVAGTCGGYHEALSKYPFLVSYHNALADHGLGGSPYDESETWWRNNLIEWEQTVVGHLPLRALRDMAGLSHEAMVMLLTTALVEEDVRFAAIFQAMHGITAQPRPTLGLMSGWWRTEEDETCSAALRRLREIGLINVVNPDEPRMNWGLRVPESVWDAMQGLRPSEIMPGLVFRSPEQLTPIEKLIVPNDVESVFPALEAILRSGNTVIVRGPQHNGRGTLLGSLARMCGLGILELDRPLTPQDDRLALLGPLATLLQAMPCVRNELAPGQTVEIVRPAAYAGPIGIVMGKQGGLRGSAVENALTVTLGMPDPDTRRRHWVLGAGEGNSGDLDRIAERLRMTSGNIHRTSQLARTYAASMGESTYSITQVQQASRTLNRQVLDSLARRLEASGNWDDLAAAAETANELRTLEARCRHRERLGQVAGPALGTRLNCGVRALLSGPSGTGKTLAARLLASVLQMDIYRIDLSSVVNKYIGETEKNLNEVFDRAEELDVILLLDEGDALLTQRTNVHTSNDRYANLETNFLLQKLESFEGILIITTNAGDRIDDAFERRMDIVVNFRLPDAGERRSIWQMHLPASRTVDEKVLQEVVTRCALSGGQIRNAALHASLLAVNDGGSVTTDYLVRSVQREYQKIGAVCPLRMHS